MIITTTTSTPALSLLRGFAGLALALTSATTLVACDSDELDALDALEDADGPAVQLDATRLAALDEVPVEELSQDELALMAPAAPPAANHNFVTYACNIDVLNGSTTCDPTYVDANQYDPQEWTATANMRHKGINFRRMDVFTELCEPTKYALSLADSPSANGWGGDSGHTDHDAEMHLYGTGAHFFSTTDYAHGVFANHSSLGAAVDTSGGCQVVHTVLYQAEGSPVGVFSIDGGNSPLTIRDDRGFQLETQACAGGANDPARGISCDHEDAGLDQDFTWHLGLNRTVGSGSRDGTGVQRACVVLHEDINSAPESCLGEPMSPAEPEGTWKFCIPGGDAAQMNSTCESYAQNWVGMFGNNTYTTQDYINMWGDPCPQGTSIVPNSQFYVPNSCNPLPNVGVGCAGDGSFNYEHQIGVMCQ